MCQTTPQPSATAGLSIGRPGHRFAPSGPVQFRPQDGPQRERRRAFRRLYSERFLQRRSQYGRTLRPVSHLYELHPKSRWRRCILPTLLPLRHLPRVTRRLHHVRASAATTRPPGCYCCSTAESASFSSLPLVSSRSVNSTLPLSSPISSRTLPSWFRKTSR